MGLKKTIDWIRSNKNLKIQIYIEFRMIEYLLNKNKTFKEALLQLEKNSEKCLIITQKVFSRHTQMEYKKSFIKWGKY